MGDKPLTKQKKTARAKGYAALGTATTTALLSFMLSWAFVVPGAPLTAWLTYRWFKYRAKWGMKF